MIFEPQSLVKEKLDLCPCGKTGKADLDRIRRTIFMSVFLFWLPIRRYKCYNCMQNRWISMIR
jgi:hypothetical protein